MNYPLHYAKATEAYIQDRSVWLFFRKFQHFVPQKLHFVSLGEMESSRA